VMRQINKYRLIHGVQKLEENDASISRANKCVEYIKGIPLIRKYAYIPGSIEIVDFATKKEARGIIKKWYDGYNHYNFDDPELTHANRFFAVMVYNKSTGGTCKAFERGIHAIFCCEFTTSDYFRSTFKDNVFKKKI
uniref:SCP domain-containing protein n=1 Tax=Parastrongyloides trichosuri TaxID=131310 RepID=A0A0N4Z839_PARTI